MFLSLARTKRKKEEEKEQEEKEQNTMNTIRCKHIKARKPHWCGLCGRKIQKGEIYEHQVNVLDGIPYDFRAHLHCEDLSSAIWDYVDPEEGMTCDYFLDAVRELADTFYCPFHCEKWNKELHDCDGFDTDQCIRKFAKFMKTHELQRILEPNRGLCWRMVNKEVKPEGAKHDRTNH